MLIRCRFLAPLVWAECVAAAVLAVQQLVCASTYTTGDARWHGLLLLADFKDTNMCADGDYTLLMLVAAHVGGSCSRSCGGSRASVQGTVILA
jgi:hypothetical protein